MGPSDNVNSFLAFIKQNLEEFTSLTENNSHLNWEGSEAKECFNDLDVR